MKYAKTKFMCEREREDENENAITERVKRKTTKNVGDTRRAIFGERRGKNFERKSKREK